MNVPPGRSIRSRTWVHDAARFTAADLTALLAHWADGDADAMMPGDTPRMYRPAAPVGAVIPQPAGPPRA